MSAHSPRGAGPLRIALFGGSFDPPHRGHVAIARAAADGFELDHILFAPAGRQPLKRDGHSASYTDRLHMVTLACAMDPRFAASNIDQPRPDGLPNYTFDTLKRLARLHPGAAIYNLAGADSFEHLAQWHAADRLIDQAEWIVVSRPGVPLRYPEGVTLTPAQQERIHLLNSVCEDVSATDLRRRLAAGDRCEDLLPPGVPGFVEQNGLYRG